MGINILKLFLIIFLLIPQVYGSDTVVSYPQESILQFLGLDDTTSPLKVQDGRARSLQNVDIDETFTLSKRKGYCLVNDRIPENVLPSVTGLNYINLSDGTKRRYVVTGRNVYYDNSGVWTALTGSTVTSGQDNQFVWVNALDNAILTNNVDVPLIIRSTGTSVGALDLSDLTNTVTKVKCVAWFKNYLILANITEGGAERVTRFRWSDVGTIETYQDDNYIDIAELGGQQINGIGQLYDNLYFFLDNSIWRASLVGGSDIFTVQKVVENIGSIAKNSIQTINLMNQRQGLVFLDKEGRIYFFDGNSVMDLSTLIRTTTKSLRLSRLQYAVATTDSDRYILSVTTGASNTTNNLTLILQYEINEWTKYTGLNANAITTVLNDTDNTHIWFGNYDSFVYQLDDEDLDSDVTGQSGRVASVTTYDLPDGTATGLVMLMTNTAITYSATGAMVRIVSGTGAGQEKVVVYNTSTGLVVDSAFTVEPDSTSLFEIGAIDAYYKTKWFDYGNANLRKMPQEMYVWVENGSGSSMEVSQANDFSGDTNTEILSLQGSGGLWDVMIWDVDVWGGADASFQVIKLQDSGRHFSFTFKDDDIDNGFKIYGYSFLVRAGQYK